MSTSAYDRAVAVFEALASAPKRNTHQTPASLIQEAGLGTTSGYRNTALLETEGFLRRDASGTYLSGGVAFRCGLNALGAGRVAPIVEPVLLRLRAVSNHTSCLAVVRSDTLFVGPHCMGRATRGQPLDPNYRLEQPAQLVTGSTSELALVSSDEAGIPRRALLLVVPIDPIEDGANTVLGVLLNPSRAPHDTLRDALIEAAGHLAP